MSYPTRRRAFASSCVAASPHALEASQSVSSHRDAGVANRANGAWGRRRTYLGQDRSSVGVHVGEPATARRYRRVWKICGRFRNAHALRRFDDAETHRIARRTETRERQRVFSGYCAPSEGGTSEEAVRTGFGAVRDANASRRQRGESDEEREKRRSEGVRGRVRGGWDESTRCGD